MSPHKRTLNVLESLYESARDGSPELWQDTYTQMAALFSAERGSITLYSAEKRYFERMTSTYSDEATKAYDTYYRHISPLHDKYVHTPVGKTFWRVRDCPDREFLKTEFYQDLMRKEGMYDICYSKLFQHAGVTGGLAFSRPKSLSPFGKDEFKMLDFLLPHVRRALQIYLTLSDVQAHNLNLNEVVSKSGRGIMLLDRSAKVVYCNESAERIIIAKDGLGIDRNRRLIATSSKDSRRLRSVLDSVFEPDLERKEGYGGFLHISRPSAKRPLQAHISPLPQQNFSGYSPEKLALLFVFDPEHRLGTVDGLLRRIYGLTPTEARLAEMLAQGTSLKDAGELLHVKQSTIHTHMKHIFSKTDCKRQAELITLIFSGLAGLQNL